MWCRKGKATDALPYQDEAHDFLRVHDGQEKANRSQHRSGLEDGVLGNVAKSQPAILVTNQHLW